MIFELEADGHHFYCSSPEVTQKLIERGARIIGQSGVVEWRRAEQSASAQDEVRPEDPPAHRG